MKALIVRRKTNITLFCETLPRTVIRDLCVVNARPSQPVIGLKLTQRPIDLNDSSPDVLFRAYKCINHPKYGSGYIIPRYYPIDKLKNDLGRLGYDDITIANDKNCITTRDIDISMKYTARGDLQYKAQDLLRKSTSNNLVGLQTGKGKTFIALDEACHRGYPFMVCFKARTFTVKWIEEIVNLTNIKEDEVAVISGINSIKKALRNPLHYKALVCIHKTVAMCAENPEYRVLFLKLLNEVGVGTRINDESHLEVGAMFAADANFVVDSVTYLTATPKRKNDDSERIYHYMLPFDESQIGLDEEDRENSFHDIIFATINTKPSMIQKSLVCRGGIDLASYNSYIDKYSFNEIMQRACTYIDQIHNSKKVTYNRKIAIAFGTLPLVKRAIEFLKNRYPSKRIGNFTSLVKKLDRRYEELNESDIVVTTEKSFGEGENSTVEVIINCVHISWGPKYIQFKGRLRKFEDHHLSTFIDVIDLGFSGIEESFKYKAKCLGNDVKEARSIIHSDSCGTKEKYAEIFSVREPIETGGEDI